MMVVCSTPDVESGVGSNPQTFASEEEANAWGKEHYSDWQGELTASQEDALKHYVISSDHVNNYLRKGQKVKDALLADDDNLLRDVMSQKASGYLPQDFFSQSLLDQIANMDAAIASAELEQDVVVYRVARSSWFDKAIGSIVTDKGYTSTSLVQSLTDVFATQFKNSVVVEIRAAAGTNAAWIEGIYDGGSAEVLFARGTKFRIIGREGGKIIVEVVQ